MIHRTSLHAQFHSVSEIGSVPGPSAVTPVSIRSVSHQVLPQSRIASHQGLGETLHTASSDSQVSKSSKTHGLIAELVVYDDVDIARLTQQVSKTFQLLNQSIEDEKSKDAKKSIDELGGCFDQVDSADENVCWQRVVENKGTLGSHTLGGGLFLLGIALLSYGDILSS